MRYRRWCTHGSEHRRQRALRDTTHVEEEERRTERKRAFKWQVDVKILSGGLAGSTVCYCGFGDVLSGLAAYSQITHAFTLRERLRAGAYVTPTGSMLVPIYIMEFCWMGVIIWYRTL